MPLESTAADILFMTSYGLNILCFTEKLGSYLFRNTNGFLIGIIDHNVHECVH